MCVAEQSSSKTATGTERPSDGGRHKSCEVLANERTTDEDVGDDSTAAGVVAPGGDRVDDQIDILAN
jgi:hypothetical protein